MDILEEHLVPELKSTALAHDRTCFAIQDILKELCKQIRLNDGSGVSSGCGVDVTDKNGEMEGEKERQRDRMMNNNSADSTEGTQIAPHPHESPFMPDSLCSSLSARQIMDIAEPFWTTNYTMKALERVRDCPVYRGDCNFVQWLGRWARKLGIHVMRSFVTLSI